MAAWLRRAAPADGSGELARAPDEGESFFQRMMGKRKAEASPHVSPDKGAASERVDEAASYLESLAVGTSSNACGDSSGSSSSEAKPEAHGMKGVKNRVGTDAERWAEKIDKDQVFEEIKAGCGEDCKCVHKHAMAYIDQIVEERVLNQKRSPAQRRDWARNYLDGHKSDETRTGFQPKWYVEEKNACVKGMALRTGFTEHFLYARMRDVREGIMSDDAIGGARVKGANVNGEVDCDSPAKMACIGWFTGLCRELEPMPNSNLHEIDHIGFKDLFKECLMDLEATGCPKENLPSLALWRKVWNESFPDLRRRAFKSVDSKDKVRAELRRLLRKKSCQNAVDRTYFIGLRASYHGSIRRERCRYWEERLLPNAEPLKHWCYIQDGATQSWYQLPRLLDTDHGRTGCKMKLVGNLWHGHVLVLCVIHPHVPDDANLVQHCLGLSMEELIKASCLTRCVALQKRACTDFSGVLFRLGSDCKG